MQKKNKHLRSLLFLIIAIIAINWIGNSVYKRFDLTQDKRYTLSEAAIQTIEELGEPILIEVLLEGSFPAEFKRLQSETRQILEEFASHNPHVKFTFVNPTENEEQPDAVKQQLAQIGITPAQVSVQEGGRLTREEVYPWAIVSYNEKAVKVSLLKNQLGSTGEERITNSIQNLEYAFADAFSRLLKSKSKKVAVLKGNGQLADRYIADFFTTLRDYYFIAPFTLDSVEIDPVRTLNQIKEYDLIVSANPMEAFTDSEKYVLDQYTMSGGKSLWLVENTNVLMDSLMSRGSTFAFRKELNLTDFFFRYGVRINPVLVNDMYAAPIVLATGEGSASQYDQFPWFYSPLSATANNHPIVSNIEAVKFDFANAIDLLENGISKTVLLSSSPLTRHIGMPAEISLNEIEFNLQTINTGPDMQQFSAGETPMAVLLEGEFTSVYNNRVKPFAIPDNLDKSPTNKMIVISDGDLIKNQMEGNRPLELGFDKWTNTMYGNKEFLLNSVNYLLDDTGLINIRTKEISIPFLNTQNVIKTRTQWQAINLLLPITLLLLFGAAFYWYRRRKYL